MQVYGSLPVLRILSECMGSSMRVSTNSVRRGGGGGGGGGTDDHTAAVPLACLLSYCEASTSYSMNFADKKRALLW